MDFEASAELLRAASRADAISERVRRIGDPWPDSLAATDLSIPHARWVIASADMAIGAAADHLLAWRLIVTGGSIPVYSPMTLLRGALEGAVLTRWLVDPRTDSPERAGRGVAAQIDDYVERRKFEAAVVARASGEGLPPPPPPTTPAMAAADRLAELTAARAAAGIPEIPMPGPTELTMRYGAPGYRDVSWLYRLMSAFAHAKPWALHGTTLGPSSPAGTPGLRSGPAFASDTVTIGATDLVSGLVETAVVELETYLRGGSNRR